MNEKTKTLTTSRLRLVPATPAIVDAELESRERLADVLDVTLAPDWPPEHHDMDTLRFWREMLTQPGAAGWWLHYTVLTDARRPTLVGSLGYKGPPIDGVVEIGYSVVPSWRRRGLATEACRALIESAWERGARAIVARTFDNLEPSIRLLRRLGFARSQPSELAEPGLLAFTLRHD
jgi:ribosomal-protein-alanine N-acetyltransferase